MTLIGLLWEVVRPSYWNQPQDYEYFQFFVNGIPVDKAYNKEMYELVFSTVSLEKALEIALERKTTKKLQESGT